MRTIGAKNKGIHIIEKDKPKVKDNYVLFETTHSAISPGTELSMAEGSKERSFIMGYSAAGKVIEVGEGVTEFKVGDNVASYGGPYTGHAEVQSIPKTLVSKVPDNVDMKDASMAGLGAIAIHALRQADLQFGEITVVVGLGVYGQLISQIAHNAGYVVLPLNRSSERADLLEEVSGIKTYTDESLLEKELDEISNGNGADAVFLCVGGDSSYLTNKSLEWLRPRGKSIIVGNIEVNYKRSLMFSKEAEILISRAGGPGRYDSSYEEQAIDYPYAYVRWTEGRNVQEYIRLLSAKRIDVSEYYDSTYKLEDYQAAYDSLSVQGAPYVTQIFDYEKDK